MLNLYSGGSDQGNVITMEERIYHVEKLYTSAGSSGKERNLRQARRLFVKHGDSNTSKTGEEGRSSWRGN